MARVELLATVDKIVSSNLQPVSGASVQVNVRSTGSPTTVYSGETGGTTVSNPLVTDANGRVNGWVDEGSYILGISGSGITSYNQPYEAVRGDLSIAIPGTRVNTNTMPGDRLTDASITGAKIATGAILGKHLSESALPLGTIIAYWVPSKPGGGYAVPNGWAVMNGQALGPTSHDFPGGGTITLPNLINAALRGADPTTAYGATNGVNALSGVNTVNLSHQHDMQHYHLIPAHSHHVMDHTHYMYHGHSAWIPDHTHGLPVSKSGTPGGSISFATLGGTGTYGFGGVGVGTDAGSRQWTDGNGGIYTDNQTGGTGTNWLTDSGFSSLTAAGGNTTHDNRPAGVGVLFLIKVKNSV
jgi:hypothetical protein